MTLQARVSRVDDYTEELSRNLEKLAMEKTGGTLNKDEQIDFILELRTALSKKDVKPWRSRATNALLIGFALLLGARFLPATVPHHELIRILAVALAALAFAFALLGFGVSIRRNRRNLLWVNQLEDTVNKGGTVFDLEP